MKRLIRLYSKGRFYRPFVRFCSLTALFLVASLEACCGGEFLKLTESNRIELVSFEANSFLMGRPKSTTAIASRFDEKAAEPEHEVFLSAFAIGKYPITVEQYCDFLNAVGFRSEFMENQAMLVYFSRATAGKFKPKAGRTGFPVADVTVAGAVAFCKWMSEISGLKCRLPSEAEWEYVAKGVHARTYPWGETVISRNPYGSRIGDNPDMATPEGVHDLNGPVYQYCIDKFDSTFYVRSPKSNPVCATGDTHVVRGGPLFRFNGQLTMPPTWKRFQLSEATGLSGFRIVVVGHE